MNSSQNTWSIKVGEIYNGAKVIEVDEHLVHYYKNGCKCYCSLETFKEKYLGEEKEQK
jgi:hypothetical protein